MKNNSRAVQMALLLCLALTASATFASQGNSASNNNPPPEPPPAPPPAIGNGAASYMQQTDAANPPNLIPPGTPFPGGGLDVQVNGSPVNISGADTDPKTGLAYYLPALPAAPTGTQYVQRTDANGTFQVLINSTTLYDVGPRYLQTVQGYQTYMPAEAINALTASQLEGSHLQSGALPTDAVGVTINGAHNDNSWVGGIANSLSSKWQSIEALIASAKQSHDTFVDLTTQSPTYTGPALAPFGTPTHPVVVYAEGTRNPDGTVSESGFHFAGQFSGYGILVISIDDPSNGGLITSGLASWSGLVVLAYNKVGSGVYIDGRGNGDILGGTYIYNRNNPNPKYPGSTMFSTTVATFRGNGAFRYSSAALKLIDSIKPQTMQVRSWRRVPEGQ